MYHSHTRNIIIAIFSILASIFLFQACAEEDYAPCAIPKTSALKDACYLPSNYNPDNAATAGKSIPLPTCASDYVFDCTSRLCAVYAGSEPFCTKRCKPTQENCPFKGEQAYLCECADKSCVTQCPGGGECKQFSGAEFYCVPKGPRPMQNTKTKKELLAHTNTNKPTEK